MVRFTRVVDAVIAPILAAAGVILFFFAGHTGRLWAWTLQIAALRARHEFVGPHSSVVGYVVMLVVVLAAVGWARLAIARPRPLPAASPSTTWRLGPCDDLTTARGLEERVWGGCAGSGWGSLPQQTPPARPCATHGTTAPPLSAASFGRFANDFRGAWGGVRRRSVPPVCPARRPARPLSSAPGAPAPPRRPRASSGAPFRPG